MAENGLENKKLFENDDKFLEDPLHLILADDVHAVTTRSKAKNLAGNNKEDITEVVSKPYARQIIEKVNSTPTSSDKIPNLKGVQVAMPI